MRYEPPPQPDGDLGRPGVAAALLLGAGRWGCSPPAAESQQQQWQPPAHPLAEDAGTSASSSQAAQPVVLQSLSLWVAPADGETSFATCVTSAKVT